MVGQLRALGTFLLIISSGLAAAQGIPSLRNYDDETRRSMELACISAKTEGPAAYGACLNQQIASLQSSPGIPNLSGHDSKTGKLARATSGSGVTNPHRPISGGTAVDSDNGRGRFTAEHIKIGERAPLFDRKMLTVIFVFLLLYFVPTIVASGRKRRNTGAIFVLNLFLGWSLIGKRAGVAPGTAAG